MRLNTPRWLLAIEGLLLLCGLLVLAYKAAMWVRPLGVVRQPAQQKSDPFEVVQRYYREFPERYIRVSGESWRLDFSNGGARHSLTLQNTATVAYRGIRLRFRYESAVGKELGSREITVPGGLRAGKSLDLEGLSVPEVPPGAERVVTSIAAAEVAR